MSAGGDVGRVVVLDVVGLRPEHVDADRTPNLAGVVADGSTTHLRPPFPAVTVPSQTTLATGQSPSAHGDVSSGIYDRERDDVEFWGRDRGDRTRLWESAADAGLVTGALFFQHLIGTTATVAITPSPIEDENDDLIEMDCWTNPDGWYDDLRAEHGHFPLHNYWGPAAGEESTEWILAAATDAVEEFDPDLLWVYVPHLDYGGLRYGPDAEETRAQVEVVDDLLGEFLATLRDDRWDETAVNVVSEYGFHAVDRPVFPNRALRDAGLLDVADDGNVDLDGSAAFAMVDHQVAHVYADDAAVEDARAAVDGLDGVEEVLGEDGKADRGVDHPNAGALVLVADPDAWFQYYWWTDDADAPAYATDTDIHAKPGFDPCELFFGETGMVSLDPSQVGGSHGRVDDAGLGIYGVGGPAAPDVDLPAVVDARAVAPTIADLLDLPDLDAGFEAASLADARSD